MEKGNAVLGKDEEAIDRQSQNHYHKEKMENLSISNIFSSDTWRSEGDTGHFPPPTSATNK